jgi:hypothetical protein
MVLGKLDIHIEKTERKINSKWIKELNVRLKNFEAIRGKQDTEIGIGFLNRTVIA